MHSRFMEFSAGNIAAVSEDPWAAEPVVVARLVEDPQVMLSKADLEGLLQRRSDAPRGITAILNQSKVDRSQYEGRAGLEALRQMGATLMLTALQRELETIRRLCQEMIARTDVPCFANAYLTPPQNQGFEIHWDLGSVVVLQVAGSKTWELRRPVIRTDEELNIPYSVRGFLDGELDQPPYLTVTLQPGDCLFIPRAWVHFARATHQESLHLSFGALHRGIDVGACSSVYP